MPEQKRSICIFIHFFEQNYIPYYVEVFANELARFFDEVVLLSNVKHLRSLPVLSNNVSIKFQENKGYDFGRFYNYYKTIDKDDYFRIAVVNDSNILINNLDNVLDWGKIAQFDFWGLIDSYEKPRSSTFSDNYHIQSYFLVLHDKAIAILNDYFERVKAEEFQCDKTTALLRREVIIKWEIGLSQFLISKGIKIGHFFDCKEITKHFKIPSDSNISVVIYEKLLAKGYPLIKKKAIFHQKIGNEDEINLPWKKLIRKYGNPHWDLDTLIEEIDLMKNEYHGSKPPGFVRKIIIYLQRIILKTDRKR